MELAKKKNTVLNTINLFCVGKIALVSVLILVILFSQFNSAFILINYQLNKEVITQKFCVNKNKPQMKCNGKCHMKKQLEKSESKNSKADFSNENEIAKMHVSGLQLPRPALCSRQIGFAPYNLNFLSPSRDVSSPPPKRSC